MENKQKITYEIADLENLFANSYEKLYACAFRMTANHQNAEDVLHNTYEKAHKNIDKFKGKSSLYTWVYRILINESKRYFKYIDKIPVVSIAEMRGVSEKTFFESIKYTPSMDDNLIIDELREKCLRAFLMCLPQKQRICFILKTCLDLKNKEIAQVLETSVGNVKVIQYRAREKLKEFFYMRCSLIDPENPCKCHLWIKYMKDNNHEIPSGYDQIKNDDLKELHFKNMSKLKKIEHLYRVDAKITREEFFENLKKLSKVL